MESPTLQPESPMEQEDMSFPCMGCGEILEEGKAFELSGQRWHIDCFRCSTCNTLLDSDAHLLLLGDGSLICSNCTYSCNSCGNKIEDLAILTGDQAFCAQCFRCRNCKRKIENLRYARTSQGIFCMDCHESLMQRRRKKKAVAQAKRPGTSGMKLDKSLPSLPPSMEETRSIDETPSETGYVEAATEALPGSKDSMGRSETAAQGMTPHSSILQAETDLVAQDDLILPSSTYRSSRHLAAQQRHSVADSGNGGGEFLIPLAFDPNEGQRNNRRQSHIIQEAPRDYFSNGRSGESSVRASRDGYEPTGRPSTDTSSAHIAYQERNWDRTNDTEAARRELEGTNGSELKKPFSDLSKFGKAESSRSSPSDLHPALRETSAFSGGSSPDSTHPRDERSTLLDTAHSSHPSNDLREFHELGSADSARGPPPFNPSMHPPKRGGFFGEQTPPHPKKGGNASLSEPSRPLDNAGSPSLPQPRYTSSDFSQDEDLARLIGGGDVDSFLRMRSGSNSSTKPQDSAVKSPRTSKVLNVTVSQSPTNGNTVDTDLVASPLTTSSQSEEMSRLRSELRKERKRIAEMEHALRAQADVKQVNTELSEKRSTMVVLDARKEIVMRELSVLTDHIEAEKRGAAGGPLDLGKLSNHVLRELAESMHNLKESYSPQIEELIQKRNDLTEELSNLDRMKQKAFQEFEQLSSKNAQLAELNNQLVHQIQELYKSNQDNNRGANGLGISHTKDKSINSLEALKPTVSELAASVSTAHISEDGEPATATVVPGPQVVSIRKGQPRKFNWKKGGQNVAKGVKGLRGALMGESEASLPRSQTQDPSRQGFGFFGNQRKQGGKLSHADSVSALAEPTGLFGTDLEARMENEKSIIPYIVTRCIQEVELRGMDMEGIYRKSGAASLVQVIRDEFEKTPFDYDLSDPDLDIHAVTSTLKQYFRKLPNPLITYDVYETIIDSQEMEHAARVDFMIHQLSQLPRVHRDVLEFLMFHLKRVIERQEENLMTSQNIAVVFAPTLMRPESLAREMTDVQKKNEVLKFLVEHTQEIFMGLQHYQ
ncbi:hypothetical protein N7468_001765 [Penicillium chermesinum]|uniref:Rho GTPase activator Rga n=1 Tax=Penicillium chermesinum TaxID=63820 RepID=A0A9W9PIH9_9EURO|nr:uncharacterized protein N7468_001765 [Penicillium chermesinum]KAJ5246782.1 hypothetical protein N7468_001765 [Penicillium chermesinum]